MGKRKRYSESCQVSELKTFDLNGHPQKVLIEGKERDLPILIFLHGGPGSPIPFCAGSRGLYPDLTDRFIMVYWDQLGCGINDCAIDDSFSIGSYVQMTIDLINALRSEFPNNPINLFAVSWGSILAAHVASERPDLLNRVLVYGQVMKDLFLNDEVFEALKSADLNEKEQKELDHLMVAEDAGKDEIVAMAALIRKHTEGYQAKEGGGAPMGKVIWGLLTSPDYTLKDLKAVVMNGTLENRSLYDELVSVDLQAALESVRVPYLIMQGDTDIVASRKRMETFVKGSKNENLSFDVVAHSGHMPSGTGMDAVIEKGFAFLVEDGD